MRTTLQRFSLGTTLGAAAAAFCLAVGARSRAPAAPIPEPEIAVFEEVRAPAGQAPFGVAVADFDEDGKLDLAVTSSESKEVLLLLASGRGTFATRTAFTPGKGARGIAAADLDGDGHVDLVVAGAAGKIHVWLGDGKGEGKIATITVGGAPVRVAAGDLNGDGRLDVAVADEGSGDTMGEKGRTSVLHANGKGGFDAGPLLASGMEPADLRVADFDGDARNDIAVVNRGSGDVSIYQGRAGGLFSEPHRLPLGGQAAKGIAVADLDGDGDLDLAVGIWKGFVPVFANDGRGNLGPWLQPPGGSGLCALSAADLNGDGRTDLAAANAAGVTVILARAKGGFALPYTVEMVGGPSTIVAADVDADGRTDLVTANAISNDVSILFNRRNETPTPKRRLTPGVKATKSSPTNGG